MSGDQVSSTAVYCPLGGRDQRFELRLGEIRELERLCGAGIAAIFARVALLQFRIDDIRETIRLGLIGGGSSPPEAAAIVSFSVDGRPVNESVQLAADILRAIFDGIEPVKTSGAEPSGAPETSAPSMNSGQPPVSVQETSTQ